MNNSGVKIVGDLNKSIDYLEYFGKEYFQKALRAGASVLKKQTRYNLSSALPKSSEHNPRFSDTLLDAIRNSKTEGDVITVHILGTRQKGSGTYRTRFFEGGTKERYQKTYRGVPLKKKRFLGRIKPLYFFSSAIVETENQIYEAMEPVINELITNAEKQ